MARLLIEDVTLDKTNELTARIRFKGGATKVLNLPIPVNRFQLCRTSPEVIAQIDELLDHYNYPQIAAILNERGLRSGVGKPFDSTSVSRVRYTYGLKNRYNRLRERGLLTLAEIAALLGIHTETVRKWHRHGLLEGHACNDANQCLYERPAPNPPGKNKGIKLAARRHSRSVVDARAQEVQYET